MCGLDLQFDRYASLLESELELSIFGLWLIATPPILDFSEEHIAGL